MLIFALALIASFIPYGALVLWLFSRRKNDETYRAICRKSLWAGVKCTLAVLLASFIFNVVLALTGLKEGNPLLYAFLYAFLVLAFSEELMKSLAFERTMKKNGISPTWVESVVFCSLAGIGFGAFESLVYAVGASVPVVLVRGISMPHVGLAFIIGYFYGKAMENGQPKRRWIGILPSLLLHGLYDFSLKDEFLALNDNLVFIPFALVAVDIILVFVLIRFVRKRMKTETVYAKETGPEL